jgi:hypothetical protein
MKTEKKSLSYKTVLAGATLLLVVGLSACTQKTASIDESDAARSPLPTRPPQEEVDKAKADAQKKAEEKKDTFQAKVEEKKKKWSSAAPEQLLDSSQDNAKLDTYSNAAGFSDTDLNF